MQTVAAQKLLELLTGILTQQQNRKTHACSCTKCSLGMQLKKVQSWQQLVHCADQTVDIIAAVHVKKIHASSVDVQTCWEQCC